MKPFIDVFLALRPEDPVGPIYSGPEVEKKDNQNPSGWRSLCFCFFLACQKADSCFGAPPCGGFVISTTISLMKSHTLRSQPACQLKTKTPFNLSAHDRHCHLSEDLLSVFPHKLNIIV